MEEQIKESLGYIATSGVLAYAVDAMLLRASYRRLKRTARRIVRFAVTLAVIVAAGWVYTNLF